ncbi:putative ribonuclease H-like domain-containing protein [Tanacetum coccineum]
MKKMYCLVVTDDYSRFSWVFFLATKDETSGILKSFIIGVENLIDQRVKVIRCDNGTEFKNKEMNQFCERKGIKREFSVARTPQKNGVDERKNRTLIKAARTMLANFKLPTTFWAEAVNIACYVQNRFDGKANEGFFVGYSINSKAFRVFNSKTMIVEENLHVQFSENTPNIAGSGPNWLFDIDALTNSPDAGFKPSGDNEKKVTEGPRKEGVDPSNKNDSVNSTNNINTASDGNSTNNVNTISSTVNTAGIEVNAVSSNTSIELPNDPNMPELEDIVYSDDYKDVGAEADMNNLNTFMPFSPIPTIRIHKDHPVEQIIRDLNSAPQKRRMTKNLEEHSLFKEPKKVIYTLKDPRWIEAMQEELLQFKLPKVWTLVDLPIGKRPIGTKWVYRNKKDERGIAIKNKARLVAQGYIQEEGIYYDEVFAPVARIEAIRQFLADALFKDFMVYQMDVKCAFLYGKIEEEVYVCQPPGFEDPDFPERVSERKDRQDFVYQKGQSDILLVQVYVDDIIFGSTKKSLYIEFEKMMHKKFQMSSIGELTFFQGLQVKQKEDGIFISQDKYVTEILKKFSFSDVKTASTPMETHKPLLKDADVEAIDEHIFQVNPKVSHLYVVKRIFRYLKGQPKLGLWYPKDSPFDLVAYTDSDYTGEILDRKSTIGGCQFLECRLISWQCKKQTVVANSITEAKYIYIDNESTICIVKNPVFHSKTKHIEIRHHFIRDSNEKKLIQMIKIHTNKNVADLLTKEFDKGIGVNAGDSKLMLLGINLLLLEKVNAARHNLLLLVQIMDFLNANPIKYALTVNPTIYTSCIEQFWATAKVKTVNGEVQLQALVDGKKVIITETSVRRDLQLEDAEGIECLPNADIFEQLALMGYEKPSQKLTFYKAFFSPQWKFLIHTILQCLNVLNGEEVFVAEQSEKVVEEVVSTAEVSVAATITTKEITLAQALAELRSAKPKLQAEEEEQARLARENAEKVEEANIS